MATIRRFEDLDVWKKARELARLGYSLTDGPRFKDFKLLHQMRSASVSILSNIAEGFGRSTDKEFVQFLYIARASASELQSQSYVALDQRFFTEQDFQRIYEETDHTCRMLANLIKYLRSNASTR